MAGGGIAYPSYRDISGQQAPYEERRAESNRYVNMILGLPKAHTAEDRAVNRYTTDEGKYTARRQNKGYLATLEALGKQKKAEEWVVRNENLTKMKDELARRNRNKEATLRKVRELDSGVGSSTYRRLGDFLNWLRIGTEAPEDRDI